VSVSATASLPIEFDYGPIQGDPDLVSSIGTTPAGSYTVPTGVSPTASGSPRQAR
jgi:hypothetical protein